MTYWEEVYDLLNSKSLILSALSTPRNQVE